jgi:hypothetical protein
LNPLPLLVDRLAQLETPANYSPQKAAAVQDVTEDNGRATERLAPVSRQEESSNGFNGDSNGVAEKDDGSEGGSSLAVAATSQADKLEQMVASQEREQLLTGQKIAHPDRDLGRSVDNHLDEEEEEEEEEEERDDRKEDRGEDREEDRGEDAETDPDLTEGDIAMPDVSPFFCISQLWRAQRIFEVFLFSPVPF